MFSGLQTTIAKWQALQDGFIAAHNQYLTVHTKDTVSGVAATYDSFFKESTSPGTPHSLTGVTITSGVDYVVAGIIYHNPGGMSNKDQPVIFPIGTFEPDSVVFDCLIADIEVGGYTNVFDNCEYVVLSTDTERRYEVLGQKKDGLGAPYILHVHLGHSTVAP